MYYLAASECAGSSLKLRQTRKKGPHTSDNALSSLEPKLGGLVLHPADCARVFPGVPCAWSVNIGQSVEAVASNSPSGENETHMTWLCVSTQTMCATHRASLHATAEREVPSIAVNQLGLDAEPQSHSSSHLR